MGEGADKGERGNIITFPRPFGSFAPLACPQMPETGSLVLRFAHRGVSPIFRQYLSNRSLPLPVAPPEGPITFSWTNSPPRFRTFFTADPSAPRLRRPGLYLPVARLWPRICREKTTLGDHLWHDGLPCAVARTIPARRCRTTARRCTCAIVPWASRQIVGPPTRRAATGRYLPLLSGEGQDGRVPHRRGDGGAARRPVQGRAGADPRQLQHRPLCVPGGRRRILHGCSAACGGGQLQRWANGQYNPNGPGNARGDELALCPKIARLTPDNAAVSVAPPQDLVITGTDGKARSSLTNTTKALLSRDPWMHRQWRALPPVVLDG